MQFKEMLKEKNTNLLEIFKEQKELKLRNDEIIKPDFKARQFL